MVESIGDFNGVIHTRPYFCILAMSASTLLPLAGFKAPEGYALFLIPHFKAHRSSCSHATRFHVTMHSLSHTQSTAILLVR